MEPLIINAALTGMVPQYSDNPFVPLTPEEIIWAATGIGRFQFSVNCLAIAMGGHVRVGLEDALYYDWEHREHATNAGLIDRIVHVAHAVGRRIATVDEVRGKLGLDVNRGRRTSAPSMRAAA